DLRSIDHPATQRPVCPTPASAPAPVRHCAVLVLTPGAGLRRRLRPSDAATDGRCANQWPARALLRVVQWPLTQPPTATMVAITATRRRPSRTVYSTSAAPSSFLANLLSNIKVLRIYPSPKRPPDIHRERPVEAALLRWPVDAPGSSLDNGRLMQRYSQYF